MATFEFLGSYEPNDFDDEPFLSQVPLGVLKGSITSQFDDPLEYRKKDYVKAFISKYSYSKENMLEDDLIEVEEYKDKFIGFMQNTFDEYLSVGFPDLEDLPEEDQLDLIHYTYRFFIKNIKKNFVNIILNYLINNETYIIDNYEKKKDVTTVAFKSEIDNEYDILILSNLGIIIDDILSELVDDYDVEQFLDYCTTDELENELEFVKDGYKDFRITGNFIKKYVDMISVDSAKADIQSKIRNKILKKYPKRSKLIDIVDEEEVDNSEES